MFSTYVELIIHKKKKTLNNNKTVKKNLNHPLIPNLEWENNQFVSYVFEESFYGVNIYSI